MLTMTLVLRARLIRSFSLRTVANRGRLWWLSWGGAPSQYSRWWWRWWGRPAGRQTSLPALLRTSLCKKFFYQEKIFSGWTPNAVFSPRLILGVGWCCSVIEIFETKWWTVVTCCRCAGEAGSRNYQRKLCTREIGKHLNLWYSND